MKRTIAIALLMVMIFLGVISMAYSQPLFLGEYPIPYESTLLSISSSMDDSCHTLDFEGITDTATVALGSYYEPWGYYFSDNALVVVQIRAGGDGNFEFNPSGVAVLFWLEGDSTILNVPSGFATGFSFYYCSATSASVQIYSGENGTGTLLGSIPLVETPPPPDYDYWYSNWVPVGVSFDGIAKSIVFSGVANYVGFDNITFCDSIPTPPCSHQIVPDAYSVCALGSVRVCLDICEGNTAYFSVGCDGIDTVEYMPVCSDTCLFVSPSCATAGSLYFAIWDSAGVLSGDTDTVAIIPGPEFDIIADPSSDPCHDSCFYVWTTADPGCTVNWTWASGTYTGDTLWFCPDGSILHATVYDPVTGCSDTNSAVYQPGHPDYFRDDTICCGDSLWICAGSPGVDSIQWYVGLDTTDLIPVKLDSAWCFHLTPEIYEPLGVDNFVVAVGRYFERTCEYRDFVNITINCPDFEITGDTLVCPGDSTVLCVVPPDYPHQWGDDGWDTCLTVGPVWEDTTVCLTVWDTTVVDTAAVDIVFYIDRSGSVGRETNHLSDIEDVICDEFVPNLSTRGFDCALGAAGIDNGRDAVCITDADASSPGNDLDTDLPHFCTLLDWLLYSCSRSGSEYAFSPLLDLRENHNWRPDAKKVIIVIADAGDTYCNDMHSAMDTLAALDALCYFIYVISSSIDCEGNAIDYFETVANSTGGQSYVLSSGTMSAVLDSIGKHIESRVPSGCRVDTCITIHVLDVEDFDTSMCVGDTMTFCCYPYCDSLGGSKASDGTGITVFKNGVSMPELLTMSDDSCCWNFIPNTPGSVTICQNNYYDGVHDCCYNVCWHIQICCAPQGSLVVSQPDTDACEWDICFYSGEDSCYPCCPDYDSLSWNIRTFNGSPFDTTESDSCLHIRLFASLLDSAEVCVTAYSTCDSSLTCEFTTCTTLVCTCYVPCCSLELTISPNDTICEGDSVDLCAYLTGYDCPSANSIHPTWTIDSDTIGFNSCLIHYPETTTQYCFNGWYENICGDTCWYDTCITITVIEYPESLCPWPNDTTICINDTLKLCVPCGYYGDFQIDSTVVFTTTGTDTDTVGTYSAGGWCWIYYIPHNSGCPATTICRSIYAWNCNWVDCMDIYVCDTPSVKIVAGTLPCPADSLVEVCIDNLTPSVSIDIIEWCNGANTECTNIPITQITTPCGGVNSFEPETVWVKVAHICDSCGPDIDTCWRSDTTIIEPYFRFWIDILPTAILPGDSFRICPQVEPDSLVDGLPFNFWLCEDDSTIHKGISYYPNCQWIREWVDSTSVYCASFIYDGCEYWACDSIFVADSFLTIIKEPCAGDLNAFLEVNGYRRYNECAYTFPVYDSCVDICTSDEDIGIPGEDSILEVYSFDHWEDNSGGTFSSNPCTTYCLSSSNDTIYAIYTICTLCANIVNFPTPDTTTGEIAIKIINDTLNLSRYGIDTVFTYDNGNLKRFNLYNCGNCSLMVKIRWVSSSNESSYPCPLIELTNSPIPEFNKLGVIGQITDAHIPSSYSVIKDTFTNINAPGLTSLAPDSTYYLYLGVVSSGAYDPCYPQNAFIDYKIKLELYWETYLP